MSEPTTDQGPADVHGGGHGGGHGGHGTKAILAALFANLGIAIAKFVGFLLEDSGALVGLMLALGGVGMALITDDSVWDAYATLAIGVLLAVIAVILIIEMRSLLLGEASPAATVRLRGAIESSPSVRRLIHVRTMHVGPEELLVAAKVEFDASLDFTRVSNAIDETEARIRSLEPNATLIYPSRRSTIRRVS